MRKRNSFSAWLKTKGLTQQTFADNVGISIGSVAKLSSGYSKKPHTATTYCISMVYPDCPFVVEHKKMLDKEKNKQ